MNRNARVSFTAWLISILVTTVIKLHVRATYISRYQRRMPASDYESMNIDSHKQHAELNTTLEGNIKTQRYHFQHQIRMKNETSMKKHLKLRSKIGF